jgi:LuxR family transcriptional regulator, maltose regulon positive regulatory protein
LWVRYASAILVGGQTTGVEEKLQAAEAALAAAPHSVKTDDKTRDLIGRIAAIRATLALNQYQVETILIQSHRALEYLPHDNLLSRFSANWAMAMAYHFRGERAAAGRANAEALSIAQVSGNIFYTILATTLLGQLQELENQLYQAAETYRHVLQLAGDLLFPVPLCGANLGLARICFEWNDLESAEHHIQQSLQLARQHDSVIDRSVICEVFLARLKLTQGDVEGAAAMLAETEQSVRQNNLVHRIPEVVAAQVLVLLRQGDLSKAAHLVQTHDLPFSQARVHLAQGDPSAALAILEPLRQQMEVKGWVDDQLKVMVLQAAAFYAHGEKDQAVQLLGETLTLAEPGGFIRLYIDEGKPMAQLLREAVSQRSMSDYISKLLSAFEVEKRINEDKPDLHHTLPKGHRDGEPLIEPLSERELEVLKLLRTDLNGPEIARELTVSLSTLRTHTQNIYAKLGVNKRRAAVRRAEELDLL